MRKIIKHHIEGGTRESHPRVQDLQHPRKPRRGLLSWTLLFCFVFFSFYRNNKLHSLIGWDIFDFSKTLKQNSTKLDRKQDLNVLYKVCVFLPIGKTWLPPWPLIGWDIFDFSSETAEQNSTKLDRKRDLNVLYRVCVFRANRKKAALASDWLRNFRLSFRNRWTEFNETWQEADLNVHYKGFFPGRSENQDAPSPLICRDIYDFSSENNEQNYTKVNRKQYLNILYKVSIFVRKKNPKWPPAL